MALSTVKDPDPGFEILHKAGSRYGLNTQIENAFKDHKLVLGSLSYDRMLYMYLYLHALFL